MCRPAMKKLFSIIASTAGLFLALTLPVPAAAPSFRILIVNSYSSDWIWVREQTDGFKAGLGSLDAEFLTVDLDVKNQPDEAVGAAAKKARKIVGAWNPHLVFSTDDAAQAEVASHFVGGPVPFVFSGVNQAPEDYGFSGASNVTGVLEREHFAGSLRLLREIWPGEIRRLAVITDDDPTWAGVRHRMKEALAARGDLGLESVEWIQPESFEEFKTVMSRLEKTVDAVGLLGIFRFTADEGGFTDYETVLRWVTENSTLPDFSFWDTRVERGTLCALTVSGTEQGLAAGRMARSILLEKTAPSDMPPESSSKGRPMISLARANKLGVRIRSELLLRSEVISNFAWNQ